MMTNGKKKISDGLLVVLLAIVLIAIDQIIKVEVKTNMCLGDSLRVTNWFYISFVENNGMAYGMTFINKLALSLFRIVAVGFIGYYIYKMVHLPHRTSYLVCLTMILAGASGNIFDSMLYGLIFTASTPFDVSTLVPLGEGYASFLYGRVVDMFYFPIIETTWPEWIPFVGGEEFVFFSPVFNFADACISVGVIVLLLFFRNDMETLSSVFSRKQKNDDINGMSDAVKHDEDI